VTYKPNDALHELARRAIQVRLSTTPTSAATAEAMQLSCGELYRILEMTMGAAGLQALIARAIQIASRDYPWLADVRAGSAVDCVLSGFGEAARRLDVDDAMQGSAALLATILSLLTSFIGEDLTFRFVRHAWPKVSLSRLHEEQTNG
jgi:hypothetical protein